MMPVSPESIAIGKCYLTSNGQVARVLKLSPEGDVHYEFRSGAVVRAFGWNGGVTDLRSFGHLIEREVPCDWTPETRQEEL